MHCSPDQAFPIVPSPPDRSVLTAFSLAQEVWKGMTLRPFGTQSVPLFISDPVEILLSVALSNHCVQSSKSADFSGPLLALLHFAFNTHCTGFWHCKVWAAARLSICWEQQTSLWGATVDTTLSPFCVSTCAELVCLTMVKSKQSFLLIRLRFAPSERMV